MENILSWFILKSIPGIGNHLFKRLYDLFKSPESVLSASFEDLIRVDGISHHLATTIKKHKMTDTVKKDIDLIQKEKIKIVTMAEPDYPELLLQLVDPPPFLYVSGNLDKCSHTISVVGSRNATGYGISTTKRLCRDLAALNHTVVSGMARGIDTAAHQGALQGNGKTIAVLGSGLGNVYPPENRNLFHRITENGAVISEFHVMAEPEAHHFPIRNRIISGMSYGTLVVEATKKSGSLITAKLAAEQGREVFAIPGSIQSFKSTGTHSLLKQGAKLVENVQDIIEELPPVRNQESCTVQNKTDQNLSDDVVLLLCSEELTVYNALEPYPVHIDDIIRKITMEPGKLSGILLKLELKGAIDQLPGKFFSISEERK